MQKNAIDLVFFDIEVLIRQIIQSFVAAVESQQGCCNAQARRLQRRNQAVGEFEIYEGFFADSLFQVAAAQGQVTVRISGPLGYGFFDEGDGQALAADALGQEPEAEQGESGPVV